MMDHVKKTQAYENWESICHFRTLEQNMASQARDDLNKKLSYR